MRVRPGGNALLDLLGEGAKELGPREVVHRDLGLGIRAFARFSDEFLLDNVLVFADYHDLLRLAAASRAFRALALFDPLWKNLFEILTSGQPFTRLLFTPRARTWRQVLASYLIWKKLNEPKLIDGQELISEPAEIPGTYYSDTMFRAHACATNSIKRHWLSRDNVRRIDASLVTEQEFIAKFEKPNIPVVIKNAFNEWQALKKWGPSDKDSLVTDKSFLSGKFGENIFRVGPFDTRLKDFLKYCVHAEKEENSLYLFDSQCFQRYPELLEDVKAPLKFFASPADPTTTTSRRDLFSYLGESRRPDYRWLIVGQERSGSCWHIDPNFTNAWNAAIHGRKKWILFPPSCPPPGVYPSNDGAEVLQPVSLYDWFENFYDQAREQEPLRMIEFIANPGDLVFIPCRWWHCVLNLDDFTVAVTQNYVSESNLHQSLRFMREHPELISGLPTKERKQNLLKDFQEALITAGVLTNLDESTGFEDPKLSDAFQKSGQRKKEESFSFGFSFD